VEQQLLSWAKDLLYVAPHSQCSKIRKKFNFGGIRNDCLKGRLESTGFFLAFYVRNRATTRTHIYHCTIFPFLDHCGIPPHIGRNQVHTLCKIHSSVYFLTLTKITREQVIETHY
jgi:hypothetical protein